MSVITCQFAGSKLGNATMQWLWARGYAQRQGCEFQCEPWIGQQVWALADAPITAKGLPQRSELDLQDGEVNVCLKGYAQNQKAMLYTKAQAQAWLKLKWDAEQILRPFLKGPQYKVVAHMRRGDFAPYGYPVVSLASYEACIAKYKLNSHLSANFETFLLVSEHSPRWSSMLPSNLSFLPDFLTLLTAKVLLRANSSFSWVAALLSNAEVYSPVIDGLVGGKDHDVEFIPGNHPKLSNLAGCTNLHLPE